MSKKPVAWCLFCKFYNCIVCVIYDQYHFMGINIITFKSKVQSRELQVKHVPFNSSISVLSLQFQHRTLLYRNIKNDFEKYQMDRQFYFHDNDLRAHQNRFCAFTSTVVLALKSNLQCKRHAKAPLQNVCVKKNIQRCTSTN